MSTLNVRLWIWFTSNKFTYNLKVIIGHLSIVGHFKLFQLFLYLNLFYHPIKDSAVVLLVYFYLLIYEDFSEQEIFK